MQMTQMSMMEYDFISENQNNQCHQRSICIYFIAKLIPRSSAAG